MARVAGSSHVLRRHALLHRWPSALGLLVAASVIATGANRETAAVTVCVAALCYLAAAAAGRPRVAWAAIVPGSLLVFVSELAGLVWWGGVGVVALVLTGTGLLRRAPQRMLIAQLTALAGFGGLAVVALFLAPRAGLVLAGAALASHAVWDLVHYRRNQVVAPSLAEFCMLLDVPLGIGVVLLAVLG